MKKIKSIFLILFILIGIETSLFAEKISVGIKFCSFSMHPKGSENAHLMPYKFDPKAILVFNPGGSLNLEYFINNSFFSIKFVQGLYADCALQFLGFSHAGFRLNLLQTKYTSISIGIGPTFIYRKSWYTLPGYKDYPKFLYGTKNEDWEYRFIWYGGELEFNFKIFNMTDFSISIIPGGLDLINVNFGFRHTIENL